MTNNIELQCEDVNLLAEFLALRHVSSVTREALRAAIGRDRVDLLILLGCALPCNAMFAAEIMQHGLASRLMISGGWGHSTTHLMKAVRQHPVYGELEPTESSEAETFLRILTRFHGMSADGITLETQSTNCGSNAIESLRVLRMSGELPGSVLLMQDPTMQMRTWASFRHTWKAEAVEFVSFAPFLPRVTMGETGLVLETSLPGLWEMDRFLSLLMGEIPRLRDDTNGYGPRGRGFIGHVEIPPEVLLAHERLRRGFPQLISLR